MTSLKEYQKKIVQIAVMKEFDNSNLLLETKLTEEYSEFILALRNLHKLESDETVSWETIDQCRLELAYEFADWLVVAMQIMYKKFDLDLDIVMDNKLKHIRTNHKKTIGKDGRIVRK